MATDDLRFVCSDCGVRAEEAGDCDACGEGPLVDARDAAAIGVLRDLDRQAVDQRRRLTTMVAVPVGMAVGTGLAFVVPAMLPIPFGRPLQAVLMMALTAFGVMKGLTLLWPAPQRFSFLEGEITASVRGEVGAMQMAETRRPLLVVAGLAVVGTAIGVFAYFQKIAAADEKDATRVRAAQALADMQHCLLGAKLRDVPSPAAQVRRIELAGNDPKKDGAWPQACAQHVTTLYEALDDRDLGPQLKQELRERFACDAVCNPNEPGLQLVGFGASAATAGLADLSPSVAGPTMVTDTFITKEEIGQIAPGDAVIRDRDYLADGRARYLFNSRGQGLSYCAIKPDEESGRLCSGLTLPISSGTAKLASGTEDTLIEGRARAFDSAAYFDTHGSSVSLYQGKANGFVLSHLEERKYRIEHITNGEVASDRKLKMPEDASAPILIDDFLLYTAPGEDDERWLYARTLRVEIDEDAKDEDDAEKIVTKRRRVGEAGTIQGTPQICRSGDARALLFGRTLASWSLVFSNGDGFDGPVAVRGAKVVKKKKKKKKVEKSKKDTAAQRAKLRDASEFGMIDLLNRGGGGDPDAPTAPWGGTKIDKKGLDATQRNMWADQLGGAERARRAALPRHAFSCGEGRATLTWRAQSGSDQVIHRVRCTAEGCVHDQVEIGGIRVKTWWTATTLRAGDGTEQVLLVWRDRQGLLRRRIAPLAELGDAEDVRVMDSAEFGGPTTLDLEAVYGRTGVVFVFRGKGFHALRFGADGSATPL
jgi:hypothetical protein